MKPNFTRRKIYFILFCFFIFTPSCEFDRSTIGSLDEPELNYNFINDYEFETNRYFFIDTYYMNRYEKGFSEDLQTWSYEPGTLIRELNVYKSAGYTDRITRMGVASIPSKLEEFYNLTSLDDIPIKSGETEVGEFVSLVQGRDYVYNYALGYFNLSFKVKDSDILAIAYRTDHDTVGTLQTMISEDDTSQYYVLRLIKSQTMSENYTQIWPLMMRNVYFLGDTSFVRKGFNIHIRRKDNNSEIQEVGVKRSFAHLLGLDLTDENGALLDNGDGQADNNYYLCNLHTGTLIFPGIQPFNPLPDSRFQIADTNRVYQYNTTDRQKMMASSKFEIVVQYIKQ